VIGFIDKLTGRVIDYYAEIANMKMRGPGVAANGGPAKLKDLWNYFKYVVRNEPIDPRDFAYYDEKVDSDLVGNQEGIIDEPPNSYRLQNEDELEDTDIPIVREKIRKEGARVDKQVRKQNSPKEATKAIAPPPPPDAAVAKGASLAVTEKDPMNGGVPSTVPPTPALDENVPDDISSFLAYHTKGSEEKKEELERAARAAKEVASPEKVEAQKKDIPKRRQLWEDVRKEIHGVRAEMAEFKNIVKMQSDIKSTADEKSAVKSLPIETSTALPKQQSITAPSTKTAPLSVSKPPNGPRESTIEETKTPAPPRKKEDVVMTEAAAAGPPTESLTVVASKERPPRFISTQPITGKGEKQVPPLVRTPTKKQTKTTVESPKILTAKEPSHIEVGAEHLRAIEKHRAELGKWWEEQRKHRSMLRPMRFDDWETFAAEDVKLMEEHYIKSLPSDAELGLRPTQSEVIQNAINAYLDETKRVVEPLGNKPSIHSDPSGIKIKRWLENYENQVAPVRARWNFPDVYAALLHKLQTIGEVTDEQKEGIKKILGVYFNTPEEREREKEWRKKFKSSYGHV
jgi:hypothetical protein